MQNLNSTRMANIEGGDFWGGLKCGLGIVVTVATFEIAPLSIAAGVLTAAECASAGW